MTGALQGQVVSILRKAFEALRGIHRKNSCDGRVIGSSPTISKLENAGSSPVHRAPLYHYVIVREDLSRGTALAQTVHAAGESSVLLETLPEDTRAVVLAAQNEAHLLQVEALLRARKIPHRAIREPDMPHNGALMAIGLVPSADRKKIQKVTSKLPLLR